MRKNRPAVRGKSHQSFDIIEDALYYRTIIYTKAGPISGLVVRLIEGHGCELCGSAEGFVYRRGHTTGWIALGADS
jgi:hypothetical protein